MKKLILATSVFLYLMLPAICQAQEKSPTTPMTKEIYTQKIIQRLTIHLGLTSAQQSQVEAIVMKYGEVPADGKLYPIAPDCDREMMEAMTLDQKTYYKKNYDKVWTTDVRVKPAPVAKPSKTHKKKSAASNK